MYYLDLNTALKELKVDPKKGLSEDEVRKRREEYGLNILKTQKKRTLLHIILEQFENTILWLLLLASLISFLLGEELEAIAIFIAVAISIGFSTFLEVKADSSLEKLKEMTRKKVLVLRGGKIKEVFVEELVPGDVLILQSGGFVGGDAIVIESHNLHSDESHLTGESYPVGKRPGRVKRNTPLAERFNVVFAGSYIVKGEGKAVVFAIGENTELGKIAKGLEEIKEEKTPLMKNLNKIGEGISILSLLLVLTVFIIGYFQKREIYEIFLYSITLAVAAVPEGLAAVLTIMLTLSVIYMAKNNALVKKVSSVETIGNIDLLGVDKTGTITEGKLGLIFIFSKGKLFSIGDYKLDETLEYAVLSSSAKKEGENIIGDDIDVAIVRAFEELGGKKKRKKGKLIPFDPSKKYSLFLDEEGVVFKKGAYEIIWESSTHVMEGKEVKKEKALKDWKGVADSLASRGYRVIAVSKKRGKKETLIGFLAFSDKEKENVEEAIKQLKRAGIKVIMLTGDNKKTAKAVATRVGIEGKVYEWKELENLGEEELYEKIKDAGVIARSTPESKLKIVEVAIAKGHIISVTGDGVNDALALKKAHVGVVMGGGSDVSKEVGDLILLDNNFYTLVKAIKYGRNLINNIINFIRFQFTANLSAIILTLLALIAKAPFPLTPLQLLWINIIMDGPPGLSLGFEKPKREVMESPPRKGKHLLTKPIILNIVASSLYIANLVFYVFMIYNYDLEKAVALSFNTFVFFQLFNALNSRSLKSPFYEGLTKNKWLIITIIVMALIQISINYLPITQEILNTKPLSPNEWIEVFLLSSSILIFEEAKKKISYLTKS